MRNANYTCRCYEGGPVSEVTGLRVDGRRDDDLPDSMLDKQWSFTGTVCDHCGRRGNGQYKEILETVAL